MQVAQIDFQAKMASQDFAKSLKDTGFAVIKNHPIDYALVRKVFAGWEIFFNDPNKENYLYKNDTQDGFFPLHIAETAVGYSIKDIKEFYHYYPWGQCPPNLVAKTQELYEQMTNISILLLQWIEEHLPATIQASLTEPLTQMISNSKQTLMRILHYPPLTGEETKGAVRAGIHTDINLITVLVAASQSGLQVKDSQGNWLDVPVNPGMLSINIGDMLQEATNGFYRSTKHQVINPINEKHNKSRFSIPLFLHPRPEVVLSNRYTAGSFLEERLAALGIKKVN